MGLRTLKAHGSRRVGKPPHDPGYRQRGRVPHEDHDGLALRLPKEGGLRPLLDRRHARLARMRTAGTRRFHQSKNPTKTIRGRPWLAPDLNLAERHGSSLFGAAPRVSRLESETPVRQFDPETRSLGNVRIVPPSEDTPARRCRPEPFGPMSSPARPARAIRSSYMRGCERA